MSKEREIEQVDLSPLIFFMLFCLAVFLSTLPVFSAEEKEHPVVTYGSTIKLMNIHSKNRLHSHEIPYGMFTSCLSCNPQRLFF